MDENLELEQEIEEAFEETEDLEIEETEDEETEEVEDVGDSDDDEELEYDEDGNVIEAESEDDEAAAQIEERETNITDTHDAPSGTDTATSDKLSEREAILRDVLKAMGIETDDIDEGLIRLAADAKGDTVEKYLKDRNEARKAEEAQRVYQQVMMERMVASDLNELHSLFPETKDIAKFENIPNCRRYAELRDMGLSVREAYSAANPDARREAVVNSVKQQTINASKSHLRSNVPIASKDTSVKITRAEMDQMRELFPDKSDKELVALYKKTK